MDEGKPEGKPKRPRRLLRPIEPSVLKPRPIGEAKKRPVLTITLSEPAMYRLEEVAKHFQILAENLPSWVEIPKTKAAVAAWLVNRNVESLLWVLLGILQEKGLLQNDATQEGEAKAADDIIKKHYELAMTKTAKEDPFFQALRPLMELYYE